MKNEKVTRSRLRVNAGAGRVPTQNNDNAPTAVKKDAPSEVTKAASSENASSAKLSVPERQKLAQQSAGKVLTLLDLL